MAATHRDEWDEKTELDERPGATFAANESGERLRSLHDIYATGEDDLEVTRVRDVPSAVLRAAADPDKTLEVRAGELPELPVSVREPAIEVPQRSALPKPRGPAATARMDAAVVLGMVLALVIIAATMAIMAAHGG